MMSYSCVQAQEYYDRMKLMTKNLMDYLLKEDSIGIYALLDGENLKEVKRRIRKDCSFFTKITKKYGMPTLDKMQLSKGKHDENVISVILMDKIDSSFNLRKCELVVFFYPDRFLSYSQKILNYVIMQTPLLTPEKKIIRLD
jgi:hypothetical protein